MKRNDFTLSLLGYSAERDECIGAPSRWLSPPALIVDTPLLQEMNELAEELWQGPSRLVWYFLVGGPGNGKSEAVGAFVRRLNELARRDGCKDVIVPGRGREGGSIPYWFVGNLKSGSLTVLQDVSVPRTPGSDPSGCKCEHDDHHGTCLKSDCDWVAIDAANMVYVMELCADCRSEHVTDGQAYLNVEDRLIRFAIRRLYDNDEIDNDEKKALLEIWNVEGFGGREDNAVDETTAVEVVRERLAWLRDMREEGLR